MKHILLFAFLLIAIINTSFAQHSLLLNELPRDVSLDGKISLFNLVNPGESFEHLAPLGEPREKSITTSFIGSTYTFSYEGLTLTYVDVNGENELTELVIHSTHFLKIHNECIKRENNIMPLIDQAKSNNARSGINLHYIESTRERKFGNGYTHIEVVINDNNESTEKIILRRRIN